MLYKWISTVNMDVGECQLKYFYRSQSNEHTGL